MEFKIDPGSTCPIIIYLTFIELNNIQTSGNKARTYNGSQIPMIGYAIQISYLDTTGHIKQTRVLFTEKSQLLGVHICQTFLKALYPDIPAVEQKTSDKRALTYDSLNKKRKIGIKNMQL